MWCNSLTHSLSLFIDLSPCEKVYCWTCSIMLEEISETKKKKKKKDDIRADLFLAYTHTYRFQWYVMITFFSSFNLCRPVCCRTCHCSSSTTKVSVSKQAIWYLIGYLFAFDLDQSSTCLRFSFSSSVESSSLSSLMRARKKKKKKKKSRDLSTFFQFLFILTWLFRYEYRY